MGIEEIGNMLGAKTVEKAYDDGLSSPVKETGKALTDVVKSFRLFTLPFQLAASLQDRLDRYFQKIRNEVPEERQMNSPSMISGPIIERLKYLEENNHLTELFLNLLARSIDTERVNEAHPAFIHLIDQLSPDEAIILIELKNKDIEVVDTMDYDKPKNLFTNRKIIKPFSGTHAFVNNFPNSVVVKVLYLVIPVCTPFSIIGSCLCIGQVMRFKLSR